MSQNIEQHNSAEHKKIETEKKHLERSKAESQMQSIKLNELHVELQKCKNESAIVVAENKMFKEKLAEYISYDVIKEENTFLKAQLESIKISMGEKFFQKYQQAKNVISDGKGAFKPVLQRKRSVTFATADNTDDCDPAVKTDEFEEIGEHLLNAIDKQYSLENKFEEQSLAHHELRDLCEMQLYESRQLHNEIADIKVHMHQNAILVKTEDERIGAPIDTVESTAFIECAKERLRSLESEAERVDRTFRDYQHRMTALSYPTENEDYYARAALLKIKLNEESAEDANTFDLNDFVQKTMKIKSSKTQLLHQDIDLLLNKNKILMSQLSHNEKAVTTKEPEASKGTFQASIRLQNDLKYANTNVNTEELSVNSTKKTFQPNQYVESKTQEIKFDGREAKIEYNPTRNRIVSETSDTSQTHELESSKGVPIEKNEKIKRSSGQDDTDKSSSSSSIRTYSAKDRGVFSGDSKKQDNEDLTNALYSNFKNAKVKIEYEPDSEQSEEKVQIEHTKQHIDSEDEDF
jgi:hypothetical protein